MKKILFLTLGLSSILGYTQNGRVGINSYNPQATLEIMPNSENSKEDATSNEGLLIPRLSKNRVSKINSPQESTMIYITDESPNTIASYKGKDTRVSQVFNKGYYIFENGTWKPIVTRKRKADLLNKEYTCSAENIGQELQSSDGVFTCIFANGETGEGVLYGWSYEGMINVIGVNNILIDNTNSSPSSGTAMTNIPMHTDTLIQEFGGNGHIIYFNQGKTDKDLSILKNFTDVNSFDTRHAQRMYARSLCLTSVDVPLGFHITDLNTYNDDINNKSFTCSDLYLNGAFYFHASVRILE